MVDIVTPPVVTSEPLDITDLTQKTMAGTGVLDVLLQTMRIHLGDQFDKERIQGTDYAQVYLGALQTTMQTAIEFLTARRKLGLELQLLEAQVTQAEKQATLTDAQTALVNKQIDQIADQMQKTPYEIILLQKQADLLDSQIEQGAKQLELLAAQIEVQEQQVELLKQQVLQSAAQVEYYNQKTITEKAQTDNSVVGTNSVVDTQNQLMAAQKSGYTRNAEQQAAQIVANTWNVRRQTDEDTSANTTNLLDDATVGKTIQALLAGIGVTVTPA